MSCVNSLLSGTFTFLPISLSLKALCLSVAVLLYVVTRDKLNNDWDSAGTELLVGMLETPDTTGELSRKEVHEMSRIKIKIRFVTRIACVRDNMVVTI